MEVTYILSRFAHLGGNSSPAAKACATFTVTSSDAFQALQDPWVRYVYLFFLIVFIIFLLTERYN
jgi:hypothetical protein